MTNIILRNGKEAEPEVQDTNGIFLKFGRLKAEVKPFVP